ncbi:MAG: hypothetical protein HC890_00410 [Chloroflexaceae bacterium]|nr:hypothetical protein [Chloroflexaceae bacterium]
MGKYLVIPALLAVIFGFGQGAYQAGQAGADTLTPDAKSYQIDRVSTEVPLTSEAIEDRVESRAESAKTSLGEAINTIKEKLNLDEPLPYETQKFMRQLQGEEPIADESKPAPNLNP